MPTYVRVWWWLTGSSAPPLNQDFVNTVVQADAENGPVKEIYLYRLGSHSVQRMYAPEGIHSLLLQTTLRRAYFLRDGRLYMNSLTQTLRFSTATTTMLSASATPLDCLLGFYHRQPEQLLAVQADGAVVVVDLAHQRVLPLRLVLSASQRQCLTQQSVASDERTVTVNPGNRYGPLLLFTRGAQTQNPEALGTPQGYKLDPRWSFEGNAVTYGMLAPPAPEQSATPVTSPLP